MRNLYVNVTLFPLLRKDFKTNFIILISLKGQIQSKEHSKCYKKPAFPSQWIVNKKGIYHKNMHIIIIITMHIYVCVCVCDNDLFVVFIVL